MLPAQEWGDFSFPHGDFYIELQNYRGAGKDQGRRSHTIPDLIPSRTDGCPIFSWNPPAMGHHPQHQLFHCWMVLPIRKFLLISRSDLFLMGFHPLVLILPSGTMENKLMPSFLWQLFWYLWRDSRRRMELHPLCWIPTCLGPPRGLKPPWRGDEMGEKPVDHGGDGGYPHLIQETPQLASRWKKLACKLLATGKWQSNKSANLT